MPVRPDDAPSGEPAAGLPAAAPGYEGMQEDEEVDERKPGAPARVRMPTALERE